MCCEHNVGLKFYSRLAKCKSQCTDLLKGFDFRTGKQVPPKNAVSKSGSKPKSSTSKVSPTKTKKTQQSGKNQATEKTVNRKLNPSKTSKTSKTSQTSQTSKSSKGSTPSPQPKSV